MPTGSNDGTSRHSAVQTGVAVVVMHGGRFLMIRRAPGIPAAGGWCFVGGAIQPGETQQAAVKREFAEEVRGRVRVERKVWEYEQSDGKLLLHWWLAILDDGELRPNPAEVSEIRWCTPDEIESLPNVLESNVLFVRAVGRGLVDQGARE